MMKFIANHNSLATGQDPESTYFSGTGAPMLVAIM